VVMEKRPIGTSQVFEASARTRVLTSVAKRKTALISSTGRTCRRKRGQDPPRKTGNRPRRAGVRGEGE